MRIAKLSAAAPIAMGSLWAANVFADAVPAPENVSAPPATAKRSTTGLATLVLEPGTGEAHPKRPR